MRSSGSGSSRQGARCRRTSARRTAIAGLATQGIPPVRRAIEEPRPNCRELRSAPPNPQASAALTTPKLLKASPLASPAAIGITWRMTRKVSPAAMHTRTAFAIWIDPPCSPPAARRP